MGTALFFVALSLVISRFFLLLLHLCIIRAIIPFIEENRGPVMSQKVVYDGRRRYFNVLMSHFKRLFMFVLIRALIHSGHYRFC